MSFLKEAFNFCVSGFATNWYYYTGSNNASKLKKVRSLKLLVKHHWGSVVGGALTLALLYFPDLYFDWFSYVKFR